MKRTWFISGTDTHVGKTAVASLWTRYLVGTGVPVMAIKPFCSGGREDAGTLARALSKPVTLEDVNPWYFPEPVSPALAAARAHRSVRWSEVLACLNQVQRGIGELVVEGSGGLLSPLGVGFDNRDLLVALQATPILVCPNRLGVINQARLVWEALPSEFQRAAWVVLNGFPPDDASTSSNVESLANHIPAARILALPRLQNTESDPIPDAFSRIYEFGGAPESKIQRRI